jgi:hypothetical protein
MSRKIQLGVDKGLSLNKGMTIKVYQDADNFMVGSVLDYDSDFGALTVDVTDQAKSGGEGPATFSKNWKVSLAGEQGASGKVGPPGPVGGLGQQGPQGDRGLPGVQGSGGAIERDLDYTDGVPYLDGKAMDHTAPLTFLKGMAHNIDFKKANVAGKKIVITKDIAGTEPYLGALFDNGGTAGEDLTYSIKPSLSIDAPTDTVYLQFKDDAENTIEGTQQIEFSDTAPQGPQGESGEAGSIGSDGPPGQDGSKGDKGGKGDKGAQGNQGESGADGKSGSGSNVPLSGSTRMVIGKYYKNKVVNPMNSLNYYEKAFRFTETELDDVGTYFSQSNDLFASINLEENNMSAGEWLVAEWYKNGKSSGNAVMLNSQSPLGRHALRSQEGVSAGHKVSYLGNPINSSAEFTTGVSSTYFDGDDALYMSDNVYDFDFGNGDFTAEGRFKFSSDRASDPDIVQTLLSTYDWEIKYISQSTPASVVSDYSWTSGGNEATPVLTHTVKNNGDVSLEIKVNVDDNVFDLDIPVKIFINGTIQNGLSFTTTTDVPASTLTSIKTLVLPDLEAGNIISYTSERTGDAVDFYSVVTETQSAARLEFSYLKDNTINTISGEWAPNSYDFYHIAATRSLSVEGTTYASSVKLYVNGAELAVKDVGLDTVIGGITNNSLFVGCHTNSGGDAQSKFFKGYIDEVRISKGLSRWATNDGGSFVPSSTGYTSDAYTRLLLCMEGPNGDSKFYDSASASDSKLVSVQSGDKLVLMFTSSNTKVSGGLAALSFGVSASVMGKEGIMGEKGERGIPGSVLSLPSGGAGVSVSKAAALAIVLG